MLGGRRRSVFVDWSYTPVDFINYVWFRVPRHASHTEVVFYPMAVGVSFTLTLLEATLGIFNPLNPAIIQWRTNVTDVI